MKHIKDWNEKQMLVEDEDGVQRQKRRNKKNELKYKTDIMEKFKDGGVVEFEHDDGTMKVARIGEETFKIVKEDVPVIFSPSESGRIMDALFKADKEDNTNKLYNSWLSKKEDQVDMYEVNQLVGLTRPNGVEPFPEDRIDIIDTGWKMDIGNGIKVILTWTNKIYHINQERDKAYVRKGSSVESVDGGAEFIELKFNVEETSISTHDFQLREKETEFLCRAYWLLNEATKDNKEFWDFVKKYQEGKV